MTESSTPAKRPAKGHVLKIVRLANGYLWIAAGVFTAVFPASVAMSPARVDEQLLTISLGAGIAIGLLFGAIGTGIILRWRRVRWLAVALAIAMLAVAAALATFELLLPAGLITLLFAPTLALFHPAAGRELRDEDQEPKAESRDVSKSLRYALLLVVGLGLVYLVESEADGVRQWHQYRQAKAACAENGAPEVCGQAALLGLLRAQTVKKATESMNTLAELCRDGRPFACRMDGLLRTRTYMSVARQGGVAILRNEAKTINRLCADGNVEACFARSALQTAVQNASVEAARRLCHEGEEWGCKAWERLLTKQLGTAMHPLAHEAVVMSCDAGFRSACLAVGIVTEGDRVELCQRGWSESCAILAAKTDDPVERAALLALTQLSTETANVGNYGITVPDDVDFETACEGGMAVACHVLGLQATDGELTEWRPPPLDIPRLDATFGRACELGHDAACVAYAVRLLNRPLDETRDIARANSLLQVACDRGWQRACWMRNYENEILAGDFDALRESSRAACREVPRESLADNACDVYAQILSHDLGASPWVMADRVGYARLRKVCAETSDYFACARVARINNFARTIPVGAPLPAMYAVAWDAASRSCSQGYLPGCNEMLTVTLSPGHRVPQSFREVQREICEQQPELCDKLYK